MSKWYIEKMKYILISDDGPITVIKVPDGVADDFKGFINLFYDKVYYKKKSFYLIDEFIDFINRKCPEHPAEVVEVIEMEEEIPQKYKKCHRWNF